MPRIAIICFVVICLVVALWIAAGSGRGEVALTYSQFLEQVRAGQVASAIIIAGNSGGAQATCRLKDGKTVRTVLPSDYRDAMAAMQDKLVNVEIRPASFGNAMPFFVLLAVWIFLILLKFPNGPRFLSA